MNTAQQIDINEVRGLNHKICHAIFTEASMYAL